MSWGPFSTGCCERVSVLQFSAGWCLQPVLNGSQGHCRFGPVLNGYVSTGRNRTRYEGSRTNVQFSSSANWIYTTVNNRVFDIVHKPLFTFWGEVEGLFRDNEMHCVVYLEAELQSVTQGDSSIDEYCTTLNPSRSRARCSISFAG